ncbi:MAG TPA: xanthine dehydrogenase family protein molybdopterin-binding subunit [Bryobacteraceae bacterium]|nr:xanthine dehydrogenase family protein molybdopterin-binding subunit [Bryobacteraceae bacterium]
MANTPDYHWPPMDQRKVIGTSPKRLDGPVKSSGRAKYSSDLKVPGMLFGAYLYSPHAHAKVTSIDTSDAEKVPGVKSVYVAAPAGTEIQWEGWEVAAVAATTEEIAREATRKIKVNYDVLPHYVKDWDLANAGANAKQGLEKLVGDPDKALQEADAVSEGHYGIPVVYHCCLEPHGQIIQWQGDTANVWPSTQNVPGYAPDLAQRLQIPATNIKVKMDYIGGGFGSKFNPDAWAIVGANLSKNAGGRPVKLYLERDAELMIAGNRPSAYAKIKIGGKKDGTITVWQSESWGTGGVQSVNAPAQPYVYTNIPNIHQVHTNVAVNAGTQRAWRAPGNQQASYLTCCALDDFAHKVGMDPIEVFKINAQYAPSARVDTYRYQLDKAAELAEWKKLWKPRGQNGTGTMKRGLGVAFAAWGGAGHAGQCRTVINPDGSVSVEIGSQDLGTGTRTVITQVAAESLGLSMSQVKLVMGTSDLPPDGGSGGSSTVGAVATTTRKSSLNALAKLYDVVAPALGAQPEELEAVDGHIRVKGSPNKSLTWQAACRKLGTTKIAEMGENVPRQAQAEGLNTQGAAGVQIADVSVDIETGIVKVNRYVAVQDCGLVINPRLSESQVYGAVIMGIGTALYEERIMDAQTGKTLNPDMEFYKLAGIADIGNIVVHMDIRPENDKRGVIGLGEPPAIPICAAIGNAVTNAIGVRVPNIPMTPDHVLAALEGRNG